jgi:hypothetical protein
MIKWIPHNVMSWVLMIRMNVFIPKYGCIQIIITT